MKTSLSSRSTRNLTTRLREANRSLARWYPGETGRRQPVHTFYGGAHLFKSDSARRLGRLARRALEAYAPDFVVFAQAIGLPGAEELRGTPAQASALAAREELRSGSFVKILKNRTK